MRHALARAAMAVVPDQVVEAFIAVRAYRMKYGGLPNLIHPRTFTEKVLYRMMFDRRPVLTTLQDKYSVREYVKTRAGEQVLPQLFWVTKTPADIPFDALPDRFVVKATHGCRWIRIVHDKARVDRRDLIDTCQLWLTQNYYYAFREHVYKSIEPRVVVEEFIDDGTGLTPTDYKCFVFDGVVRLIAVVQGYLTGLRMSFYERPWNKLDVGHAVYKQIEGAVTPPIHLAELVAHAEALGRGLDFIRVDMYDTAAKVYFGEMAPNPGAGRFYFNSPAFDLQLGALWKQSVRA
ncbi:MAG TPA: ATP-grasp fold amidoligase family protein [bacterium]|nr:ATP-grasp fold amidoligase family protein [bacterium]